MLEKRIQNIGSLDGLDDRAPGVPLRRLLIGVRQGEHGRLGKWRGGDLKANRQSRTGGAARDGNRRKAVNIECADAVEACAAGAATNISRLSRIRWRRGRWIQRCRDGSRR